MSDESFEESLRNLARGFTDRIARGDFDYYVRATGMDPDEAKRWAEEAGDWMQAQTGRFTGSAPSGPSAPAEDPLGGAGPHPLDMPTEEQGIALAALESGRWTVEPGTSMLVSHGEGPAPKDALGLVRELRVRDWLGADGKLTLAGRRALSRWLALTSPVGRSVEPPRRLFLGSGAGQRLGSAQLRVLGATGPHGTRSVALEDSGSARRRRDQLGIGHAGHRQPLRPLMRERRRSSPSTGYRRCLRTRSPAHTYRLHGQASNAGARSARGRVTLRLLHRYQTPRVVGRVAVRVRAHSTRRFTVSVQRAVAQEGQLPARRLRAARHRREPDLRHRRRRPPGRRRRRRPRPGRGQAGRRERPSRTTPAPPAAHSIAPFGDVVYPEGGNGGYKSVHTDTNLIYDAPSNLFLPARTSTRRSRRRSA